jgi:GNAT superfamily N-acetyltransferase
VSDLRIEPLRRDHQSEQFDSGIEELDRWLHRFAHVADASRTARTYVLIDGDRVLGYYSLVAGEVHRHQLPARHARGTPQHPIGVILLARLAIDRGLQGRGYGRALVADAALRAIQAADVVGARALLVHASDEHAAAFYEHLGFTRSPTDPLHLMALMKDLQRTFG